MKTKYHSFTMFFALMDLLQINRIFGYINRNKFVVLTYHGVKSDKSSESNTVPIFKHDPIHVELESFKQQMIYLKQNYNIIDINTLVDALENGNPLPERSVLITFDDGYYNVFTNAYPTLESLRIPAAVFLVTNYVGENLLFWWDRINHIIGKTKKSDFRIVINGTETSFDISSDQDKVNAVRELTQYRKNLDEKSGKRFIEDLESILEANKLDSELIDENYRVLSWKKVEEMDSELISFEPHTKNHMLLDRCSDDEARNEISGALSEIENKLNRKCRAFAYPNGNFKDATKSIVQNAGLSCAFTTIHGLNTFGDDEYELRRSNISADDTMSIFKSKLSGFFHTISKIKKMFFTS